MIKEKMKMKLKKVANKKVQNLSKVIMTMSLIVNHNRIRIKVMEIRIKFRKS